VSRPRPSASAPAERDPHLRLPPPLRVARMAEVAFIVLTSYFALALPAGGTGTERMIQARLVFEALAALVVLVMLPRRPAPVRVAAMVLAVYVLVGCVPGLVVAAGALGGGTTSYALGFLLSFAACASQLVVLACCLSVGRERLAAP
jgi:hypothetical protein